MLIYIARRVLLTLPTLLMVSVIVFTLMRLIPGDPAQVLLGEDADKAAVAAMHRELGLDRPLPEQYLKWLGHAAHGDMGESIVTHEPVRTMIADRFQLSATIALISVGLATLIATLIGMVAAWKRDSTLDIAIVSGASIVLAVPSFWLGMVLETVKRFLAGNLYRMHIFMEAVRFRRGRGFFRCAQREGSLEPCGLFPG